MQLVRSGRILSFGYSGDPDIKSESSFSHLKATHGAPILGLRALDPTRLSRFAEAAYTVKHVEIICM